MKMRTFFQLTFTLFSLLLYSNIASAQTADPIRYSLQTNTSHVGLGEEMEIVIKAERIKYPSKTVFIFKEDYSVQLKLIVPDGFIQTGGNYLPDASVTFSSSNNEVFYTLRGKFVEYTGRNQFMLLKRNQNAKEQGVYVAVARLTYSVSEPSLANQRQESTSLALNSPGYIPYMTVEQLQADSTDLEDVVNIINNNRVWTYRYDSTSLATDNGATVLVSRNNRHYLINTDVICPALFGAKGDGVADDTNPVNLALAFAKTTQRAVSGENKQYKITNTIKVDAVLLRDGTFLLESAQANIRLSGNAPEIRDCSILANVAPSSLYGQYGGAINLHLSTGAIIHNVAVAAKSIVRRIAISCISRATNTLIDGLVAKTAWGVLFNDLAPNSTDRIVDGIAYADSTIGSGLTIQNSHFYGHVNNTLSGDAIEINVPNFRFSDIQIANNRIYKTTTSDNVGIGIGLANVDNAVVAFNKLTNVASVAGALHCEWSTNVQFVGNTVQNSEVGGSFTTSQNVIVRDNYFQASKQFGIKSQNTSSTKMLGLDIINNTFIQGTGNDIIVGNIERLTIQGNRFLGMGADGLTHLNFVHYGPDSAGARNVKVLDNDFVNNNRLNISVASVRPNCFEWQSKGNNFSNYGNTVQSFMSLVSARGICEDFYRGGTPVDQAKGSIYKVNGSPQNYITGSANRIAEDLAGGVRYRFDATAAVWSIPGEKFSNPLNLGTGYFWRTTDGQLRFKGSAGAPTSDASGNAIPVKIQAAPATSTSPGKPGDFYSNSSFLYIYTGDGTTHSWARVAVSSW